MASNSYNFKIILLCTTKYWFINIEPKLSLGNKIKQQKTSIVNSCFIMFLKEKQMLIQNSRSFVTFISLSSSRVLQVSTHHRITSKHIRSRVSLSRIHHSHRRHKSIWHSHHLLLTSRRSVCVNTLWWHQSSHHWHSHSKWIINWLWWL